MKRLLIISSFLLSCGQPGQLYLSDQKRIANSENKIEIQRLNNRISREKELKQNISVFLIEQSQQPKASRASKKTKLKILKARQQLGQIELQRQLEGRKENVN